MNCSHCGAPLERGAECCARCGADVVPPKKKRGILACVIVAAVFLAGTAGVLAAPQIARAMNPKAYVMRCIENTGAGRQSTESNLGLREILACVQDQRTQQKLWFKLLELPASVEGDLNGFTRKELEGTGFDFMVESDLPARKMAVEASCSLGSVLLGPVKLFADDAQLSFSIPGLMGEDYYSVNTETVGRDFQNNPSLAGLIDPDESFHLFDELALDAAAPTPDNSAEHAALEQALKEHYDALYRAITVARGEAGTVSVQGKDIICEKYTMTIPAEALKEYLEGCMDTVRDSGAVRDWVRAVGVTSGYDATGEVYLDDLTDALHEVLGYLRDNVTADLYISENRVLRGEIRTVLAPSGSFDLVDAELTIQAEEESVSPNAFTADLRLYQDNNDLTFSLRAWGNDGSDGGAQSSEMELTLSADGEELLLTTLSYHYDRAASSDNFACGVTIGDGETSVVFGVEGTVSIDPAGKSFSADFDRISLTTDSETLALAGGYSVRPVRAFSVDPGTPIPVAAMREEELEAVAQKMADNLIGIQERFYAHFSVLT